MLKLGIVYQKNFSQKSFESCESPSQITKKREATQATKTSIIKKLSNNRQVMS